MQQIIISPLLVAMPIMAHQRQHHGNKVKDKATSQLQLTRAWDSGISII